MLRGTSVTERTSLSSIIPASLPSRHNPTMSRYHLPGSCSEQVQNGTSSSVTDRDTLILSFLSIFGLCTTKPLALSKRITFGSYSNCPGLNRYRWNCCRNGFAPQLGTWHSRLPVLGHSLNMHRRP